MMANVWLGQINKTGLLPPPIYHDHSLTDSNLFAKQQNKNNWLNNRGLLPFLCLCRWRCLSESYTSNFLLLRLIKLRKNSRPTCHSLVTAEWKRGKPHMSKKSIAWINIRLWMFWYKKDLMSNTVSGISIAFSLLTIEKRKLRLLIRLLLSQHGISFIIAMAVDVYET